MNVCGFGCSWLLAQTVPSSPAPVEFSVQTRQTVFRIGQCFIAFLAVLAASSAELIVGKQNVGMFNKCILYLALDVHAFVVCLSVCSNSLHLLVNRRG